MTINWRKAQQEYWSNISKEYDSLYLSDWSQFEDKQVQMWIELLCANSDGRLLDLGCGTGLGYQLATTISRSIDYEGIDISAEMLDRMRQKFPGANTRLLSLEELDEVPEESYQYIVALSSVLSFSENFPVVMQQIFRVLKPGGAILVSALNRFSLRRVVRLQLGAVEKFCTRNARHQFRSTPAQTISPSSFKHIAKQVGFYSPTILPLGILAGVLEHKELIRLEAGLTKVFPGLAHSLYLHARK